MSEEDPLEQRTIHFSGRVQGVGFRYTTERLARGRDVGGFVKNLPDGRVMLLVEGRAAEVERFVAAVESSMRRYIADVQTVIKPTRGDFQGFTIRH